MFKQALFLTSNYSKVLLFNLLLLRSKMILNFICGENSFEDFLSIIKIYLSFHSLFSLLFETYKLSKGFENISPILETFFTGKSLRNISIFFEILNCIYGMKINFHLFRRIILYFILEKILNLLQRTSGFSKFII